MSDYYRTLGLQPTASKGDIKNAFFRLAHRYHPDHHAKGDAAGRAAAAAAFRRVKDAYDVLYDDGRRAAYDRTIRPSSSGESKQQQGQYGGGVSSRSSGSHTPEWEEQEKKSKAEREAQEKKAKAEKEKKSKAEREAQEKEKEKKAKAEMEKKSKAQEKKSKAEREAQEKKGGEGGSGVLGANEPSSATYAEQPFGDTNADQM